MEELRLQKFMADIGLMSRRAAEREIEAGKVSVNGEVASIGTKVNPDTDIIKYKGRILKGGFKKFAYIMLNKPRGYVTTASDEKGRATVLDLVEDVNERIYPVGRLDMDSDGLLLLTNDGELTNKLTHPKHDIPKIYSVEVKGKVDSGLLKKISSEMLIDGYKIKPVKTEVLTMKNNPRAESTVLKMTLFEGRNRQIRKMCEQCDLEVIRLTRIAIGDLRLGNLKSGSWRYLTKTQIDYLKNT